jgi:MFS family permease
VHERIQPERLIVLGAALGGCASVAFVVPPALPVSVVALVLFGMTNVMMSVGTTTVRQRRFEGDLQGRLGSLEMVSGQLLGLLGMGTAAVLADRVDPAVSMAVFGIGVVLGCVGDIVAAQVLRRDPRLASDLVASDDELAVSA